MEGKVDQPTLTESEPLLYQLETERRGGGGNKGKVMKERQNRSFSI